MENFDTKTFSEVWNRVSLSEQMPQKNESSDTEKLCCFMDLTAAAEAHYAVMAQKSRSRENRAEFAALQREERENLRELQSAYFILSGDTYAPFTAKPYIISMPDALRERYMAEDSGCAAYHRAAMDSQKGSLTELYSRLARVEEKHAGILLKMIKRMLG